MKKIKIVKVILPHILFIFGVKMENAQNVQCYAGGTLLVSVL